MNCEMYEQVIVIIGGLNPPIKLYILYNGSGKYD